MPQSSIPTQFSPLTRPPAREVASSNLAGRIRQIMALKSRVFVVDEVRGKETSWTGSNVPLVASAMRRGADGLQIT